MATTYHSNVKNISQNEARVLPGKTMATKDANGLPKRKALVDLQNQNNIRKTTLDTQKNAVNGVKLTKGISTTVLQKEPKETTVCTSKPKTKTTAVLQKKSEVMNKLVSKIETECVLKNDVEVKSYSAKKFDLEEEESSSSDPQFVSEYVSDIIEYLRSLEIKFSINEMFLIGHRTTVRMRSVLINWLMEVNINFKLLPETLHLCVAIVDQYLQKNKSVGRESLQLVGITALWIASKYEEMYIPELSDFVYCGDDSFTPNDMLKMELTIIKALDYSFGRPLSLHFLRRYSKVGNVKPIQHTLAKYLLELALLDHELSHVRPSIQAAAASYLSLVVLRDDSLQKKFWSPALIHYSTYKYSDFEKVVRQLATLIVNSETSKYQAARIKYSSTSMGKISLISELKGPVIMKFAQIKK